jgi:hypothetical protein
MVHTFEPTGSMEPRLQLVDGLHNGRRIGRVETNPVVFPLPAHLAFGVSGVKTGDMLSVHVRGKGGWADGAEVSF